MIKTLLCRKYFCIDWSARSPQVLHMIKNQLRTNPNYIKQNGIYIMHHLSDIMQKKQWDNGNILLKQVDTSVIDKWQLWKQLSINIHKILSKIQDLHSEQLSSLMQLLFKLRYQINAQKDKNIYQSIKQIIATEMKDIDNVHKLYNFIMYFPQLFIHYRSQIENIIINKIYSQTFNQQDFILFSQGVISNFWTDQFMLQFQKQVNRNKNKIDSNLYFKLLRFIQLPNLAHQTKIKKAIKYARSSTEQKISQMLKDLGYIFQQNMLINNMEVDFIFGSNIIVQYNGILHYKINSQDKNMLSQTMYEKWKNKMLQRRMFKIIKLPFYQWEKYQNQRVQKLFLIQRIEKSILEMLTKKQQHLK